MTNTIITKEQIQKLATEIFEWLNNKRMWVDITIYFNGKCWSTSNKDNTEFSYNNGKYFEYEAEPKDHFEYVRKENILSMSFEGALYNVLNGYVSGWVKLEDEFRRIFEKYGLYFELGNAWNLTSFESYN